MPIIDSLRAEFEQEAKSTRRVLERVPQADFAWKPHERSMTMGRLASHLAEIPHWAEVTLTTMQLNIDGSMKAANVSSGDDLLALFDRNAVAALDAMTGVPDEQLMVPWTLKVMGEPQFTLPRIAVLRSMVFNHTVHHRGQLTVYLRLRGVPVPAIYGPSADEPA